MNRNIGVLYSKGKYLILPDPDDILAKDILSLCYKFAEKFNYEIIRFNMYVGNGKLLLNNIVNELINKKLYQPFLSTYIYYGLIELKIIDFGLCNKFYKKEAYIRALNSLKKKFLNMYFTFSEDLLMNYIIYRLGKSFFFFEKVGYYYIKNYLSITQNLFTKSEFRIKCGFIFLQILYQYTKNNKYEKDMSNLFMNDFIKKYEIEKRLLSNEKVSNINFFYNIIMKYFKCKFITNENKIILGHYKNIIEKMKVILKS